jgi:hypothetical protein
MSRPSSSSNKRSRHIKSSLRKDPTFDSSINYRPESTMKKLKKESEIKKQIKKHKSMEKLKPNSSSILDKHKRNYEDPTCCSFRKSSVLETLRREHQKRLELDHENKMLKKEL